MFLCHNTTYCYLHSKIKTFRIVVPHNALVEFVGVQDVGGLQPKGVWKEGVFHLVSGTHDDGINLSCDTIRKRNRVLIHPGQQRKLLQRMYSHTVLPRLQGHGGIVSDTRPTLAL